MICARCNKPIREDEPSQTYGIDSPSGPGATVVVHARLCKKPPTQTSPSGLGRR